MYNESLLKLKVILITTNNKYNYKSINEIFIYIYIYMYWILTFLFEMLVFSNHSVNGRVRSGYDIACDVITVTS